MENYIFSKSKELLQCETKVDGLSNSNGTPTGYSPSNIKRVIISPDRVLVDYYVTTSRIDKLTKSKVISKEYFLLDHKSSDYKPALQALVEPYVCTAIQEIIFVMKSKDGLILDSRDTDLNVLTRNKDTLANKFKRLAAIGYFNGTIEEYLDIIKEINSTNKLTYIYLKHALLKEKSKVTLVNNDWYVNIIGAVKGIGNASVYLLDADKERKTLTEDEKNCSDLGKLRDKSYAIRNSIEKLIESRKIQQFKKENENKLKEKTINKSQIDLLDNALSEYLSVVDCIMTVLYQLKMKPNSLISENSRITNTQLKDLVSLKLIDISGYTIKEDIRLKNNIVCLQATNIKDKSMEQLVNYNKNKIMEAKENLYVSFLDMFIEEISKGITKNGLLLYKVIFNNFDRAIYVPSILEEKVECVTKQLGVHFEGTRLKDSVANLCSLYSICFMTNQDDSSIHKYMLKDTWLRKMNRNKEV